MGAKADIVSACEASGTEGVDACNVMDEPRANVDWLSLVWSTRREERLRMEIGLDARRNSGSSPSERREMTFFLTSPLIGLIDLFRSICVFGKLPYNRAGSDGRRNTCLQSTCGSLEAQGLSGTSIQAQRDLVELRL